MGLVAAGPRRNIMQDKADDDSVWRIILPDVTKILDFIASVARLLGTILHSIERYLSI